MPDAPRDLSVTDPAPPLPARPASIESADGTLIAPPGEAPIRRTPFAPGLYGWMQRNMPSLAPNNGGGIVTTVVLLIMIGVASSQSGIIESLDIIHRWGHGPYWPTWFLLLLGLIQLLLFGWNAHEQTQAENAQAEARHQQAVARYEQARGFEEHRRARDLQTAMLATVVANQEAARETLPTARLSIVFRDTAKQVQVAVEMGRDPEVLPPTSGLLSLVDDAIQTVLWSILQFVRQYDETVRPDGAREATYSANVMQYFSIPETGSAQRRTLEAGLRCVEDGVSIDRLPGVLALRPEWSAMAGPLETPNEMRDCSVPALVLPLPPWGSTKMALPGGPRAWQIGGDFLHYSDVSQLRQHILNEHSASVHVADAIADHFSQREVQHVRSFFSTALVTPEDIAESDSQPSPRPPIGVVNINCSTPGLLKEERPVGASISDDRHVRVLAPFLRALLYPLAGLIEYRLWAEARLATEQRLVAEAVDRRGAEGVPNAASAPVSVELPVPPRIVTDGPADAPPQHQAEDASYSSTTDSGGGGSLP